MMQLLFIIGFWSFAAITVAFSMLQFAVGEPTGRHSRFNPKAIPVYELTKIGGAHRKMKPAPFYTVTVR